MIRRKTSYGRGYQWDCPYPSRTSAMSRFRKDHRSVSESNLFLRMDRDCKSRPTVSFFNVRTNWGNTYPQFRSWEEVYRFIVVNTSNAVNVSTTSAMWAKQHTEDPAFEDDAVFSEDTLTIDPYLEKMIEKGDFLEAAKKILGIRDKE